MKKSLYIIFFILIGTFSCTYDKADVPVCDNTNASYSQSIAPLIQTRCAIPGCHDGSLFVGNFNNYSDVKNYIDNGIFKVKVIDMKTMPPPSQPPLTTQEYNKLKCWFENGGQNN